MVSVIKSLIGDHIMKTKLLLALTLLAFASTSGFAQPQLSLGVTGGLQVYPTHGNTFWPLLGASAWFKANMLFFFERRVFALSRR